MPTSSCLDSQTLTAWVGGALAKDERDRALAHIAGCAVCREVVSALARAKPDPIGPSDPRDPRDPIGPPGEPAPLPAALLGRYQVQGVIAAGGMGVVLVATDPILQRKVAIKIRRPTGSAQASKLEARLGQEGRALAQLRHPNVVAVYDAGHDADHLFVVMELVEGESLRSWLERPHPWQEGVRVVVAAGRGLAALHAAGLAHRDVKPDNILLAADGRVLLADLGLVVSIGAGDQPGLTAGGAVVGTPRYAAPEQISGGRGDARSDQFSFGVVLREALAASGAPVPAWLRAVIQRAMDPDPMHRFSSMDELLASLDEVRRRRRAARVGAEALAAGALLSLLVLVWVPWSASPRRSAPPSPSSPAPRAEDAPVVASVVAPVAAPRSSATIAAPTAAPSLPSPAAASPPSPAQQPAPRRSSVAAVNGSRRPPRSTGPGEPAPAASAPTPASKPAAPPSVDPPLSARAMEIIEEERKRTGLTVYPAPADPERFQPSRYFATARSLARTAVPDAELVAATFLPVARDGTVDLHAGQALSNCAPLFNCGPNFYVFRSPSRSQLPAGAPERSRPLRECLVKVHVHPTSVAVTIDYTRNCDFQPGPPPRCTLAQIWAAARARGAPADLSAQVLWGAEDGWQVSNRRTALDAADVFEQLLPDDC